MNIEINDIGIDYRDSGPWRYYSLITAGDTLSELMNNAVISEVDQDGGELNSYGLDNASNEIQDKVLELLTKEIERKVK